jgi:seryl-tRNA(Sec) selenium transferase
MSEIWPGASPAQQDLCRTIAQRFGASDALVTANLPGAVALASALLLPSGANIGQAGASLVLQLAHANDIEGTPLTDLLTLGGANLRLLGSVQRCSASTLKTATAGTAGAVFVVGAAGSGDTIDMPSFIWSCHQASLPVLVLDLTGDDPEAALDAGADLLAFDAAALGADPAGVLVARSDLIGHCPEPGPALAAVTRAPAILVERLAATLG